MSWVTDRGRCTLDHILEDLYLIIQQDVQAMNELLQQEKQPYQYDAVLADDRLIVFTTFDEAESPVRRIIFTKKSGTIRSDRITVESNPRGLASFTITWAWNVETSECQLFAHGAHVTIQEVSRMALETAFFDQPVVWFPKRSP